MPSMNPLKAFSRRNDEQFGATLLDEMEAELKAFPPMPLLERHHAQMDEALYQLRGDKIRLEDEIAERTEQLRQTEIAIRAREAASEILEAGKARAETPAPDAPKLRGHTKKFDEADVVVTQGGDVLKSKTNGKVVVVDDGGHAVRAPVKAQAAVS